MPRLTYAEGLRHFYEGEIFGERVFAALAAAARSSREAAQFSTLARLETGTKTALAPLLRRHGVDLCEDAVDLSAIPERLAAYGALPWRDFCRQTADRLAAVTLRYLAIAALGPPEDHQALSRFVAHEAALCLWAEREAEGRSDALEAVHALIAGDL
jgi:hypothetical protein